MYLTTGLSAEVNKEYYQGGKGLTPSLCRVTCAHDIKVRPEPKLIRGRRAPDLITLRRAQIGELHNDRLSFTAALALPIGSNGPCVFKSVAASTATAAPGRALSIW